ncbi:hypothetical protein BJX63DRAFT_433160 [Aspergillus granulosus]|uniref:GATA-type domain-containing protein n=1 Tax=Aspergillus granulosus TaxID=176169 RepID=A0ABR4H8R6_9EURO
MKTLDFAETNQSRQPAASEPASLSQKRRRIDDNSDDEHRQITSPVMRNLSQGQQMAISAAADPQDLSVEQLAELLEYMDLEDDEIDEQPEEEVGDDTLVPGPDEFAEDLVGQEILPIIADANRNTDTPFAQKLRKSIEALATWARENFIKDLAESDRPMTTGFWSLLGRLSIDALVSQYLAGISPEVQQVFGKSSWCAQDFLSLPAIDGDQRQVVYVNIATGNLRWETAIGCEPYTGSSRCGEKREREHLTMARKYSPENLPQQYRRSFHYKQICRDGVVPNFRLLAAFDRPIPTGYLLLLEGIFMVFLNSYRYPGYFSRYSSRATYDITEKIRESLDLPKVDWKGMNAAWPLYQGFPNMNSRSPSPCANNECGKMTYPNSNRPEGVKGFRVHLNRGDPLGPYICQTCARYRTRMDQLPDKAFIDEFDEYQAKKAEMRRLYGSDAECGCCKRAESQTPPKSESWRVSEIRRHRIHAMFPDIFLCNSCYSFVDRHGRLRTPEELRVHDGTMAKKDHQKSGALLKCDNCKGVEGTPECGNGRFKNCPERNMLLCYSCYHTHLISGQLRSQKQVAHSRLTREVKEARDAGQDVVCGTCGAVEDKNGNDRPFLVKQSDIPYIECLLCDDFFRSKRETRTPHAELLRAAQWTLNKKRENGEPIQCSFCSNIEGQTRSKDKFRMDTETFLIRCNPCRKKQAREKKNQSVQE